MTTTHAAVPVSAEELVSVLLAIYRETQDYPPSPRFSSDSYLPAHLVEQTASVLRRAGAIE